MSRWRCYGQLTAAMMAWGGTWAAGRVVAQALPHPTGAAAMRFTLAALFLWLIARSRGLLLTPYPQAWAALWAETVRSPLLWRLVAMGFVGIFLYNLFFLYGLHQVTASKGALVVALNPVVVAVLAWWLAGEPHGWRQHLGAMIALIGSLTVLGHGNPIAPFSGAVGLGDWLILGCVASWTAYTFLGKRVSHSLSSLATTFWTSVIGGALLWLVAIDQGQGLGWLAWSFEVWVAVAFMGVIATALGYTWYTQAVHILGAARAALFINLVPIAGVFSGWWVLGEPLSWPMLVGGVLVLTGVTMTTKPPKE